MVLAAATYRSCDLPGVGALESGIESFQSLVQFPVKELLWEVLCGFPRLYSWRLCFPFRFWAKRKHVSQFPLSFFLILATTIIPSPPKCPRLNNFLIKAWSWSLDSTVKKPFARFAAL